MPTVVTAHNRQAHARTVAHMHADRKQVFVDQLKWRLPVIDERYEIDDYDTEDAIYLIVEDPETGGHLGSVRLIPTTKGHLLGDKYDFLCDGGAPVGDDVWEITRMCTTPGLPRAVAFQIRSELLLGMVEFAAAAGIVSYTMMTHLAYLPQLLAVGWDIEPLGMPAMVDGEEIAALQVTIGPATLDRLRTMYNIREPVLRLDGIESAAAA